MVVAAFVPTTVTWAFASFVSTELTRTSAVTCPSRTVWFQVSLASPLTPGVFTVVVPLARVGSWVLVVVYGTATVLVTVRIVTRTTVIAVPSTMGVVSVGVTSSVDAERDAGRVERVGDRAGGGDRGRSSRRR